jgi:HEAT repeat protein
MGRKLLAGGIFMGFIAGVLLGYSVRWLQDSSAGVASGSGAPKTVSEEPRTNRPTAAAGPVVRPSSLAKRAESLPRDGNDAVVPEWLEVLEQLSAAELIEALRSAAQSHDTQRFWLVAAALGPLDPSQLVQITEMLDEHRNDLKAAELFFGEIVHYGGTEGLDRIAQLVMDGMTDPKFRNTAVEALGGIPMDRRKEAVPILKQLLKSGLRFDELAGARTLGWLLGPNAVPGLVEVLDGWVTRPDGSTQIEKGSWDELNIMNGVLKAVEDFAGADDLNLLTGLFDRRLERGLQALLCQIMSNAAGAAATKTMLDLLLHPPMGAIRDVIAEALGRSADKEDVPQLRAALEAEGDTRVQMVLASLLARLAGVEEMRPLVERALDPASGLSPDVLIEPLIRAKSKDMAPLMLDLVRGVQGQYAVCRLAKGVLGLLGQEEGSEKLMSIVADGGGYGLVSEVAAALLEQNPDHDPRRLLALLERSTDGVQRTAIADVLKNERETYALSSHSSEVIPALIGILSHENDPNTQEHIASAIAGLGPVGRSSLGELLAIDTDARRRLEVLRSLELLPPQDTVSLALRILHQDPSPELRSKAARIAGRGNDPSLIQELSSILSAEEDPEVRGAIEEVLRRHGRQ